MPRKRTTTNKTDAPERAASEAVPAVEDVTGKTPVDGQSLLKTLMQRAKADLGARFSKSPKAQYQKVEIDGNSVAYINNPSTRGVRAEFAATLDDVPAEIRDRFKKGPRSASWALVTLMTEESDVDVVLQALAIASAKTQRMAEERKAAREAAKASEKAAKASEKQEEPVTA